MFAIATAQGASLEVGGGVGGRGQMGLANNGVTCGKEDGANMRRDAESHTILGIEQRRRWGATDRDRGMRWGSDNRMCE